MSTRWERQAPHHTITEGDIGVVVEDALTDSAGAVVNLTGASVLYIAWFPGVSSAKISAAAAIIGAATNGQVRYTFLTGNTDTPGDLIERWKVTFAGGAVEHFPPEPHKLRVKDA